MPKLAAMRDPTAYLTPKHISQMIEAEPLLRNKLIIRLLFRGGMRVSELCNIDLVNILWVEDCIIIPWMKRRRKEGQSQLMRKIPLDSGTMDMIRDYLMWREKYHIDNHSKRLINLDRRMVYWIVRRAAERVGILRVGNPNSPHSHPHPHTLRHSYATWRVARTGGDYGKLRKVQLDLGHADINTTASYLAVSGEELHREYDEAFEGLE